MFKTALQGSCLALGMIMSIQADTIVAGTTIPVRTNDTIDARDTGNGRVYPGVVDSDVLDTNGKVAIPKGSDVELMVRDIGHHTLSLDIDAVVVNGQRYSVTTYDVTRSVGQKEGVGANRRTGKFVGGTAVFGTILGAIAGGGRGAAIGAVAGGTAGAIGEVTTRGKKVHIPAESLVTFQLQQPLDVAPDRGYTRDGQHYHPLPESQPPQ